LGKRTKNGLRAFQKVKGLKITGEPDDFTLKELFREGDNNSPLRQVVNNRYLNKKANNPEATRKLVRFINNDLSESDLSEIKSLLEEGADIETTAGSNQINLLYLASGLGHLSIVKLILDKGAQVDKPIKDGTTPLLIASYQGHSEIVRRLLEKGAQVDKARNNDTTPLYIACEQGHIEIVRLLLDKGAQVDKVAIDGFTPQIIASLVGNSKLVKLLIDKGANVDKPIKGDGSTPLLAASQRGNVEVTKLLLDNGAQEDMSRKDGVTPFYIAYKATLK